jgi:hypothetical protein
VRCSPSPVAEQNDLLFLIREVDGGVRTHKRRAMPVRKDRLLDQAFEGLQPERPRHADRLATLAGALDP